MSTRLTALVLLALLAAPALAAGPPLYIDDRSTPEAVIRSLYNAVERKEYARAHGYFGEGAAPDYATFAAGYADTERVELALGEAQAEGAAGSTYWTLPVAIRAHGADGSTRDFVGCYGLRLAQPTIQEPPFTPLHIRSAHLAPATGDGAIEAKIPATCPEE